MATRPSRPPTPLRLFLDANPGTTLADLHRKLEADGFSTSSASMAQWSTGRCCPLSDAQLALEKATGGAVGPAKWAEWQGGFSRRRSRRKPRSAA